MEAPVTFCWKANFIITRITSTWIYPLEVNEQSHSKAQLTTVSDKLNPEQQGRTNPS